MKRVLLVGAGHAQLAVLADLARQRLPGAELLLVTPQPTLLHWGLLPALLAGRVAPSAATIDIAALAQAAGVPLRVGRAVALDAAARRVTLADGQAIDYDLLSLNSGPEQDRDRIPGAREHALFVRPIEAFAELWQRTRALGEERPLALVVVGNGAAGVELVLAARAALGSRASVALVCDGPLLPACVEPLRQRALAALRRAQVQLLPGHCRAIERRHVLVGDAMRVACDVPIVATGADAPAWLAGSGLALDAAGFVRVGATLQSESHPQVLVAGDLVAAHEHSGRAAVADGPLLAASLRALAGGGTPPPGRPRPTGARLLLSTGNGGVVAGGPVAGWIGGRWKERRARAFVARWAPDQLPKK